MDTVVSEKEDHQFQSILSGKYEKMSFETMRIRCHYNWISLAEAQNMYRNNAVGKVIDPAGCVLALELVRYIYHKP